MIEMPPKVMNDVAVGLPLVAVIVIHTHEIQELRRSAQLWLAPATKHIPRLELRFPLHRGIIAEIGSVIWSDNMY